MAAFVGLDTTLQVKVTAGASYASLGRVESAELTPDQSLEHLDGATAESSAIYSMIEPKGSATLWVQTLGFLSYAARTVANGLPTVISAIDGGVLGSKLVSQTSCYVNSLELKLAKGGALQMAVDWVALAHTASAVTVGATALAKNLLLAWHTAAVTFGGVAFNCQSLSVKLDNGLKLDTDLDAKTLATARMPTVCKPGLHKVTADIEFASYPTVDLTATVPGTVALVYRCLSSETSAKTFTHTVTNLHPVGMPIPILKGEDEVVWKLSLEADHGDLSAWVLPTLA
jgi:hypothetical protein